MLKIKNNQSGILSIEFIIFIVVFVSIFAVGAFVLIKNHKSSSTTSSGQSASNSSNSSNVQASNQWRDANISQEITSANEKIVKSNKVTVSAAVDWVNTGLQVNAGQHVWITTDTSYKWSGNPQYFGYSDANGGKEYPGGYKVDANANVLSLIGFVGASPVQVPEQSIDAGAPAGGPGGVSDPGLFEPGNTIKDFTPKLSGIVWLRNNDNTNLVSDVGQQIAEVYLTD